MKTTKLLLLLAVISTITFSCSTDDTPPQTSVNDALDALTESGIANNLFSGATNTADDGVITAENEISTKNNMDSKIVGPTITTDPADLTTFPKTITVDFGTEGMVGQDLVTRKGVITIISTNWHHVEGSMHTATFQDYYENDYKIEGTHIETNEGLADGTQNPVFNVIVTNGKITTPEEDIIHYTQNNTRTRIVGGDTPFNIWDNEYSINGTQSGISSKNITYSLETVEDLNFRVHPRGITDGILSVDVGTFEDIIIDYGESTIKIKGITYPLAP